MLGCKFKFSPGLLYLPNLKKHERQQKKNNLQCNINEYNNLV